MKLLNWIGCISSYRAFLSCFGSCACFVVCLVGFGVFWFFFFVGGFCSLLSPRAAVVGAQGCRQGHEQCAGEEEALCGCRDSSLAAPSALPRVRAGADGPGANPSHVPRWAWALLAATETGSSEQSRVSVLVPAVRAPERSCSAVQICPALCFPGRAACLQPWRGSRHGMR